MRSVPICGLIATALLYSQSSGDVQPTVIVRYDPEYSAEATRARVQSTVLLSVVIGEDGKAHDIHVAEGAGFGLDEKAIAAIETWLFNPGTKDGHIAPFPANIEMNFHLQVRGETDDHSGQFARLNFKLPPGASRPELIVGKLPGNPVANGDQALRFHLQVGADGVPLDIVVLGSTDKAWEQETLRVIRNWRFRAASLDGAAIPADGIFELAHSAPVESEPLVVEPAVEESDSDKIPHRPPAPVQISGLIAREYQSATRLGNGTVLIAGGAPPGVIHGTLSSAQIFDPVTRTIANTGNMLTARRGHTATLLNDGTVLIAGGETNAGLTAGAEIFNPSTGKFSATGSMHEARASHAAVALRDGRVLVCGGMGNSAEIYDPGANSFMPAGHMRSSHPLIRAVTLKDGRVLILGTGDAPPEIFNPETGAFTKTGAIKTHAEAFSTTLLDSGRVLIATTPDAQIFDPATDTFHSAGAMTILKAAPVAVLLNSGQVLLTSGGQADAPGEFYDPASGTFSPGPEVAGTTATLLEDGRVLMAGSKAEILLVR